MSYQIKRTPYFRRIFNNSRRNGQLQRLREEYERIQEFNDRTIEMKMRQVRLKRLFREIEDINESTPSTSNHHHHSHSTAAAMLPMTPEAQQEQQRRLRLEALERARELGQEMSRRNAELAENGTGFYLRSELRSTAKMRAADAARREAQERRQRAARRISYGNAQSRSNIKRIAQRRQRQEVIDSLLYASDNNRHTSIQLQAQAENQPHPDIVKRSMLQQRLQYGNSRSTNNMMRSQMAAAHRVMNCISLPGGEEHEHENLQQQLMNRGMQLEMEYRQHSSNNDNNRIIIDNSINDHINRDMEQQHIIDNNRVVQSEMEYQSLPTSSKNQIRSNNNDNDIINNNKISNCNVLNAESDMEMQTAMLPPTEEPETLHSSDDDMPTTSQKASARITDVATMGTSTKTTTISGFQSPRPSRILRNTPSERASERWHRISLTLPWFKVINNHPIITPAGVAVEQQQLPHNSISISIAEDVDNTAAASGASDNYQSFRGPSLMQEDLMQIMELNETNDNVQVAPVRVVRRTFGN